VQVGWLEPAHHRRKVRSGSNLRCHPAPVDGVFAAGASRGRM